MTRSTRFVAALIALALVAPAARAQDNRQPENATAPSAADARIALTSPVPATPAAEPAVANAPVGPTFARAAVGVHAAAASAPLQPAPAPRRAETKQNDAMMIVGGAALIVGAIIGDTAGTLVMVAGAGLGLWGLYQYLQ